MLLSGFLVKWLIVVAAVSISSSTIVMQSRICRDNIGKAYNEVCLLASYAAIDELPNVYVENPLNSSPLALGVDRRLNLWHVNFAYSCSFPLYDV